MRTVLAAEFFATLIALQGKTTADGVYSDAQAKRGEALYAQSCSSCHGPDLSGLDSAPSLSGPEFAAGWTDMTLDDLVERIRSSMPADAPGSLGRPAVTDIVAFILAKNGFPAGAAELPMESDALKAIKFTAPKR
jgi:mono/diheme cytochrome c family protein